MNAIIVGSTKPGYEMPKEEAMNFSGKAAGICYMPDSIESLWGEDPEKTAKRASFNLTNRHHSVFGHATYNFVFTDIPKFLARILNNEQDYNTSEKSARYTVMTPSEEEAFYYGKWTGIFVDTISRIYPKIPEKQVHKLALENARYFISVFTPATTMEHTLSFQQINYILDWMLLFIDEEPDTPFNVKIKEYLRTFVDLPVMKDLYVPQLNSRAKERRFSIIGSRERAEEFGENYCTTYKGSFAQYAQEHRHRTIKYEFTFLPYDEFYVPPIIRGTPYEDEWLSDMEKVAHLFPQGMMVNINERGTCENFILKCRERLCGAAQLEIMQQSMDTLEKYLTATVNTNRDVFDYLMKYADGPRCNTGWDCTSPCVWGPNNAFSRLI